MKSTTKLFFIPALLFLTATIYSQRYSITGGINFSNMEITGIDSVNRDNLIFRTGVRLGTAMELSMNDVFSFEPGITLSIKGYNYKTTFLNKSLAQKVNLLYVDVPVYLKITTEWGNYKIFGLIGPYASMAIKGKTKTDYRGQSEQFPIRLGNDEVSSDFKTFDYGAGVGVGMEVDKASFRITYNYGLMNISPRAAFGEEMTNRAISVYFVYFFSNYYHHHKYKY